MKQECPICQRPDVADIDAALRAEVYPPSVARRYKVPSLALYAHRRHLFERDKAAARTGKGGPKAEAAPTPSSAPVKATKPTPTPVTIATAPATKAQPPNRAPAFRDASASEYAYMWRMNPAAIARKLTKPEMCNPDWNPLHPFALSDPPEALTKDRVPQVSAGTGTSFAEMERRRDEGG